MNTILVGDNLFDIVPNENIYYIRESSSVNQIYFDFPNYNKLSKLFRCIISGILEECYQFCTTQTYFEVDDSGEEILIQRYIIWTNGYCDHRKATNLFYFFKIICKIPSTEKNVPIEKIKKTSKVVKDKLNKVYSKNLEKQQQLENKLFKSSKKGENLSEIVMRREQEGDDMTEYKTVLKIGNQNMSFDTSTSKIIEDTIKDSQEQITVVKKRGRPKKITK